MRMTIRDEDRREPSTGYFVRPEGSRNRFQLARTLIAARTRAGLSQTQLARRMKTSQSYIARIESGKVRPSTDALERFAAATGSHLRIIFEPVRAA
jgi:transcriptional regulator with XRE-family HTH domain